MILSLQAFTVSLCNVQDNGPDLRTVRPHLQRRLQICRPDPYIRYQEKSIPAEGVVWNGAVQVSDQAKKGKKGRGFQSSSCIPRVTVVGYIVSD